MIFPFHMRFIFNLSQIHKIISQLASCVIFFI